MIQWSDQYSVGIKELDEQHKEFFTLLDLLEKSDEKHVAEVLQTAEEYTQFHFQTEEALMEKTKYSEIDIHKAAHEQFKVRLRHFNRMILSGDRSIKKDLYFFMSNWIIEHILTIDKQYCFHFKQKGLSIH